MHLFIAISQKDRKNKISNSCARHKNAENSFLIFVTSGVDFASKRKTKNI